MPTQLLILVQLYMHCVFRHALLKTDPNNACVITNILNAVEGFDGSLGLSTIVQNAAEFLHRTSPK